SVPKPDTFNLNKFKSKRAAVISNVESLLTALPRHSISSAKDFLRLHPDEEKYWSPELCFVNVPIKGQRDTVLLIDEELAMRYLQCAKIVRCSQAVETKRGDVVLLIHEQSRNTENSWNASNLQACEKAKTFWIQATSRKEEGVEAYKIDKARDKDAFPAPKWPTQTLEEIIGRTFEGRRIETADHPGLLRLIGAKQSVS